MSRRKSSRLATSLGNQGLVKREQTTANGRRTYLLIATTDDASVPTETIHESQAVTDDEATAAGLDARDQRALTLINDQGGIYQSEFWKELGLSSQAGSRIATGLVVAGLTRGEEATCKWPTDVSPPAGETGAQFLPANGRGHDFAVDRQPGEPRPDRIRRVHRVVLAARPQGTLRPLARLTSRSSMGQRSGSRH